MTRTTEATPIQQKDIDDNAAMLWELEHLLDEALAVSARLTGALATGRRKARISATVGQDQIFAHLPAITTGLVGARGGAVSVHRGLAAFARSRGLTTMSPPDNKDDGFAPPVEPTGRLAPEDVQG